jgi:hypothetical protein
VPGPGNGTGIGLDPDRVVYCHPSPAGFTAAEPRSSRDKDSFAQKGGGATNNFSLPWSVKERGFKVTPPGCKQRQPPLLLGAAARSATADRKPAHDGQSGFPPDLPERDRTWKKREKRSRTIVSGGEGTRRSLRFLSAQERKQ